MVGKLADLPNSGKIYRADGGTTSPEVETARLPECSVAQPSGVFQRDGPSVAFATFLRKRGPHH